MKNIHILPTDKPSRLQKNKHNNLFLSEEPKSYSDCTNQNIYITSDEEITNCDCYVINVVGEISRRTVFKPIKVTEDIVRKEPLITYPNGGWCKKIILTTDQDLIKDGIRAIDDEFLEWFIKNQSCEKVKVKTLLSNNGRALFGYEIIIPKQEPKQETLDNIKPKNIQRIIYSTDTQTASIEIVNLFTKWQQERSYSEEEVIELTNWYLDIFLDDALGLNGKEAEKRVEHLKGKGLTKEVMKYWFEQFKKK